MLGIPNPWLILAVLLAILGAGGAGYVKGRADADRSAEIATLQGQVAAEKAVAASLQQDAAAARQIAQAHQARADQEASLRQSFEEQANAYANELAARDAAPPAPGAPPAPRCSCAFDERDVERLRDAGPAPDPHSPGTPGAAGDVRRTHPAPRAP